MADPEMFLGLPDRWCEAGKFRCRTGHVSVRILKSETRGDLCLSCQEPVLLTFPEDTEGDRLGAEVHALRWAAWTGQLPREKGGPDEG